MTTARTEFEAWARDTLGVQAFIWGRLGTAGYSALNEDGSPVASSIRDLTSHLAAYLAGRGARVSEAGYERAEKEFAKQSRASFSSVPMNFDRVAARAIVDAAIKESE